MTQVRIVVTASLVIYGLLLTAYAAAQTAAGIVEHLSLYALAMSVGFGLLVNTNYSGIGRLYRDRLMEAFLPDFESVTRNKWALARTADVFPIASLAGRLDPSGGLSAANATTDCQRPLHLVNCNVVLVDSHQDIYRTRGGDCFSISSRWSGGDAMGWIETSGLGDGSMSLATAMSISGAAANPNAAPNGHGVTRNRAVSFLMSFFNIRLGYWMANPKRRWWFKRNRPNLWLPGARQGLLGQGLHEEARFLELTDGGHFDNTGVYELVRRRTKLIVVCEAGHDPTFAMDDLANVIEKVRVDFSVFIKFDDPDWDLRFLRPHYRREHETVARGFAIGRVRYPNADPTSATYQDGIIVYLQAVPIAGMPADVETYYRQSDQFPNDTTADQFFDEEQLEAYRELGYAIASTLYEAMKGEKAKTDEAKDKYLKTIGSWLV